MSQTAKKVSQNKTASMGELLVQKKIMSKQQLVELQKKTGDNDRKFLSVLTEMGYLSETEVVSFLSEQYGYQSIDIENFDISEDVLKLVPKKFCEKYTVIPISRLGDTLVVAVADPVDNILKEQLLFTTKCKIEFVLSTATSIQNAITSFYAQKEEGIHKLFAEIEESSMKFRKRLNAEDDEDEAVVIHLNADDSEPVVRFVNHVIISARNKRASDIHIESYEKKCRVRFRIDGKLHEMFHPPKTISPYIISRMKVMSNLDIGERRKPQDGRLKVKMAQGKELDFRVSIAPTVGGEKIVMRVLDDSAISIGFKDLGMNKQEMTTFQEALNQPQGLILITGPTGSGKTTTIYSGLNLLNTPERNISTAEDPVEYKIEGLNQVQMHAKIGLTFASALRAFLRQDPDVILVGEIRDYETAEIAFKASSTGHLVVSTLHTNDTPSTVTRLLDIGIPDYSIAENISLIVGQRLLRRICQRCVISDNVSKDSLKKLELSDSQIEEVYGKIKKGKGCRVCSNIGYKGRVAVYEMLKITDSIKKGIFEKMAPLDLKRHAIKSGELKTLRQSGIDKMVQGITTFEEVLYSTVGDSR
ncbi:MAG: type IV-A pilus assembly ATPase PilB [Bdellovibrionales bacterium]|nr:type IV-A pilus assembly ATPase PilB [Bdellovibrionales bacterium]